MNKFVVLPVLVATPVAAALALASSASAAPVSTVSAQSGSTVRGPIEFAGSGVVSVSGGASTRSPEFRTTVMHTTVPVANRQAARITGGNETGLVPTLPTQMEAAVSGGSAFGLQADKGGNPLLQAGEWSFPGGGVLVPVG